MRGDAPKDPSEQLRQHPDYERAIRAYSDEEDLRVRMVLLRKYGPSFVANLDEVIDEIIEDSEVIESLPGSCAWLYSYEGKKLVIGILSLNSDHSGITYGFQDC